VIDVRDEISTTDAFFDDPVAELVWLSAKASKPSNSAPEDKEMNFA
jgi:hypothetical protein